MKIKKWISVLLVLSMVLGMSMCVSAEESIDTTMIAEEEELVLNYCQCVNARDIEGYIQLFTADNRERMQSHLLYNGEEDFFREQMITITDMKKLTDEAGYISSVVTAYEQEVYTDIQVVYAEQKVVNGDGTENIEYVSFVLAQEEDGIKIERVSVPNLQVIYNYGEQFGDTCEQAVCIQQQEQMNLISSELIALQECAAVTSATSLTAPTSITVYFTKSGNISYHGGNRATLDFNTYLRNTIHEEWEISWYQYYPAYLQAGVMANKMYAWYNTVNPKRMSAPYYACVLDDANDQNYWYNSVADLAAQGTKYVEYLDNALSYASNLALVTEDTESIFETQYRANEGTIHSGIMNQEGALQLAKNGYSCLQILQEYYGSAPIISGDYVKIIAHQ